jgi:hypothetical protein
VCYEDYIERKILDVICLYVAVEVNFDYIDVAEMHFEKTLKFTAEFSKKVILSIE